MALSRGVLSLPAREKYCMHCVIEGSAHGRSAPLPGAVPGVPLCARWCVPPTSVPSPRGPCARFSTPPWTIFLASFPWCAGHGREVEEEVEAAAWDGLDAWSVAMVEAVDGSPQRQEEAVQCLSKLFFSVLCLCPHAPADWDSADLCVSCFLSHAHAPMHTVRGEGAPCGRWWGTCQLHLPSLQSQSPLSFTGSALPRLQACSKDSLGPER